MTIEILQSCLMVVMINRDNTNAKQLQRMIIRVGLCGHEPSANNALTLRHGSKGRE